jgi:hypothetical protein
MYGLAVADEWIARGGEDTTRAKIAEFAPQAAHAAYAAKIPMPPWLGEPDLHLSHRSRLLQKEPRFYSELFPGTPADLEYVWPEPRHEFLPEDPVGDRLWILRAQVGDTDPEKLDSISLPEVGRAAKAAAQSDEYEFVYADSGSRRPAKNPKKRPPKQLVKKPTRKRQQQEEAFRTLPGNSAVAVPFNDGATFAVGTVQGRPITVDGRFARNFQVTEVVDRASFDYPALLQDPRLFFPIPAP